MASRMQSLNSSIAGKCEAYIFVFDRRKGNSPEVQISTEELDNYTCLVNKICKVFNIKSTDKFVITTTNRKLIDNDAAFDKLLPGDTLYVLHSESQELSAQARERVNFLPHYDTIVKGGMYEYYASEGQNPLPYAFAELLDNALAATADNVGQRNIEIRLLLDDGNPSKNLVLVLDNGKGMTSRQLNNWAIYRLSKFIRRDRDAQGGADDCGQSSFVQKAPRSLNSDISYFGVGGKQAIFFIGNSTRMISRAKDSKDVHELMISKEAFEQKERNCESIYSGFIRNRKPADTSHLSADDELLRSVIGEEEKASFTTVVIGGISAVHVPYLKTYNQQWMRQLAHIYHYYIHGPHGNVDSTGVSMDDWFPKINIKVTLQPGVNKPSRVTHLRDIATDMQTQFIRSAASTFEFKAVVEGTGIVEGVLRYHPFLYDRETYPSDANDARVEPEAEDDHDYACDVRPARGRRPIFECYWNGRMIPYTSIEEFDWCSVPKKCKLIPAECYNRVSGVLWTNDKFQVSTNKLTFIDLELKLRDKNTTYCRILGKNDLSKGASSNRRAQDFTAPIEKRTDIGREFTAWLQSCHADCDKQVKFSLNGGVVSRPELPRSRQSPWTTFDQIEWEGRVYRKDSGVRTLKTVPVMYGTIKRFLLFGEHEGDVFATGGDIQIIQEPQVLYNEVRTFPLCKMDRSISQLVVKKYIEEEMNKLPDRLLVTWPDGNEVTAGEKRPAGQTIGAMRVEIANRKGELISKLPGGSSGSPKKLLVELKVIWHSSNGEQIIAQHISQHGKSWPYWFRKMENVQNLGPHTVLLQVVLNESGVSQFADRQLPSHAVRFTVTEAEPRKFSVGLLEGPFRIGLPFTIPLEFQDEYGHSTKPTSDLVPVLEANDLQLTYGEALIKGSYLIINDVVALADVSSSTGKSFHLVVRIEGLAAGSQTLKIRMLAGLPASLHVQPTTVIEVENGNAASFEVEVHDLAGNISCQQKSVITCTFAGAPGLPVYSLDCAHSGQGSLTGPAFLLDNLAGEKLITARIELTGVKGVEAVERRVRVLPSRRAAHLELTYLKDGERTAIREGQDVYGVAGDALSQLEFQIVDEAGRRKSCDKETAAKMKVNWTGKLIQDQLVSGRLPDIRIPNWMAESKYCHLSLTDSGSVEFSFTLRPVVGAPYKLHCRCAGSNTLRMGESLQSDIHVSVQDRHGNEISKFEKGVLKDLQISSPGLVVSETVRMLGQKSGFNVEGIRFEDVPLGGRELKVVWRDLSDYVRLEVVAGVPTTISLVDWDDDEGPITVYSESRLPHPFLLQLRDAAGNPSPEPNVKVHLTRDPGIKLIPVPQPIKTNMKGQANFGLLTVSGKQGVYELQPKALMGRTTLSGPKVAVSIQADLTKPVCVRVECDIATTYGAGDVLPDFHVHVLAEDDTSLTVAKTSFLSMKLWPSVGGMNRVVVFPPDPRPKDSHEANFSFCNRRAPVKAGLYCVQFAYNDHKHQIRSELFHVDVHAGAPLKLVPMQQIGTPTVSNTKGANSRTLIRHLDFQLQDEYGNVSGGDEIGELRLEVTTDVDGVSELPHLVGHTHTIQLPLAEGCANVQNVLIEENTAGRDGQEYILRCSVARPGGGAGGEGEGEDDALTYDIRFLFYNDVKKQSQMAALTKERDGLQSTLVMYQSMFDTTQQLIDELTNSVKEAHAEEKRLEAELRQNDMHGSRLASVAAIQGLCDAKMREKETVLHQPRRMCGLPAAPKDRLILGKIAHLACVADGEIARVLSWHMSADMDCIVTMNSVKAQEIYMQSNGKQQVLPLDSIYKKNLPDWSKPLPHMRVRPNWRPPGDPVYARNLLMFPDNESYCRIVFGMLLGDTIILDSLESANMYRHEIVKGAHCPTILTRTGDRIRSNGKFGGLMNRALPLEKLRGAVFAEPLSGQYDTLNSQIELLQSYKAAKLRSETTTEELGEQVWAQKTPEMTAKMEEFKQTQRQLMALEQRLGMTPTSQRSRPATVAPAGGSAEQPTPKRPRLSSPASNGSPAVATPTRQSLRRIAVEKRKSWKAY